MLVSTPVLRYYNLQEEVTLQCDASQFGLGAAFLQNGQLAAYASRALTDAETRYAQIEKELLAIVFACERFEQYVYARDLIQVESDHKLLEAIFCKPLHSAPKRLQRMLLRLQKYSLRVTYKKGKDMFLADTLSRAELREYISKCDVCLAHRTGQAKEPLLQHEVVARPWSKVAGDLCELDNRTLLVIADYYSNYTEVARLNTAKSRNVIKEMKAVFARFGIPDVLVTDNGPQFASAEFAVFAKTWMFKHTTSSLYHPQSNGKAENAVKTVKHLFTKSKASGQLEFLALLDWRNTPSEGIGLSPAQRLMGRRCKTLLPVAGTLLQPRYSTEQETRALIGNKQRQQHYYNRHAKLLHPIKPVETVRMKLPGQKTWTAGTCTGQTGPRSYDVKVGETVYRRNRRQLIHGNEPPILDISEPEPLTSSTDILSQQEQAKQLPDQASGASVPQPAPLRRSQRTRRPPAHLNDFAT